MRSYSRLLSFFFPARLPLHARNLVILVFCVDFLFIFIHLAFHGAFYLGQIPDLDTFENFNITTDHSYPELFNYLQLLFVAAVLFMISYHTRSPLFTILAFCFIYVFLDDSMRFHEIGGGWLVENLNLPAIAGMRSQDLGEFMIFATAGGVFFASLVLAWCYAEAVYRRYAVVFAMLLFLLAFFAVFIDIFRRILVPDTNSVLRGMVGVIEDGGEMLVAALSCWVVLSVFYHLCPPPPRHSPPADSEKS